MQTTLRTLLDLKARTGEDRFPVRSLFHRAEDRELAYVAVDVGGWLDRREVMVNIDRFDAPEGEDWPVSLGRADLEDAPVIEEEETGPLETLPPLVVGPFGYTFSPMLMAAGMNASAQADPTGAPGPTAEAAPRTRAHGRLAGIERSTDWLGRDAFGPGGAMGPVTDVVVDGRRLTAAILEDGTHVPFERLRRIADQGHAIFD